MERQPKKEEKSPKIGRAGLSLIQIFFERNGARILTVNLMKNSKRGRRDAFELDDDVNAVTGRIKDRSQLKGAIY